VWGEAYHLVGTSMIEACLQHLGVRECHLGGYEVLPVKFIAADQSDDSNDGQMKGGCCQAWAFIAATNNEYYLGPAPIEDLAEQVGDTGYCVHTSAYGLSRRLFFLTVYRPSLLLVKSQYLNRT
jgi:ChaC-like protein